MLTNKLFKKLAAYENEIGESLIFLNTKDESFINDLFNILDHKLFEGSFSVEELSKELGVSRAQLYRRVNSISGFSPNNFIRQLKLSAAFEKLKAKSGNISQVAFQVGFSNPSYFSKCFQGVYGYLPSVLLKSI